MLTRHTILTLARTATIKWTSTHDGGMKSVNASHILVKNEKDANNILARLEKGESFEALAKRFSKCPSGSKGGRVRVPHHQDQRSEVIPSNPGRRAGNKPLGPFSLD